MQSRSVFKHKSIQKGRRHTRREESKTTPIRIICEAEPIQNRVVWYMC